ncbi:hypothetical protein FRC17_010943 [Serendipita sp. 399]|nr:hypothetical protein FRC17_010943 [Serendipita sp. 399]
MPLDTINALKANTAQVSTPSFQSSKPTPKSRILAFTRMWDDEFGVDSAASQESKPLPWSPSPERPPRPPKHIDMTNSRDLFRTAERAKQALTSNANNLLMAKDRFQSNAKKPTNRIKVAHSDAPSRSKVAPSLPLKRKAEDIMELSSDSEEERVPKRRQSDPSAAPPPPKSVKPWDQDFSKMKLPSTDKPPEVSKPKPKPADLFSLSSQQRAIHDVVVNEGKNVFFTGSAGTGKSVLLRCIIKSLRTKYAKSLDAVAITASTGIAACNIGGVTVHSFGGFGLGNDTAARLAAKVRGNQKAHSRWARTKVLIIDEISMLEGDFFDKVEEIARILRRKDDPFGGIQLVLTGDFFQLPPVSKGPVKFAFDAESWGRCIPHTYNLTKVFRQKDQTFVDILNEMRRGQISDSAARLFIDRSKPLPEDGVEPTELFPRREDVDRANMERMDRLKGPTHTFLAADGGIADERVRGRMLENFMAPKMLKLKKDAQVMMIKNVDEQLVNGTVGKVVDFMTDGEWIEHIRSSYGGNPEEPPEGSNPEDEKSKDKEKEKQKQIKKVAKEKKYPIVEWKIPGSRYTRTEIVRDEQFKVEGPDGRIEVSRAQLPLILAWAMSIHKSQGQTLEKVKVDLRKVFEKGQAYVAISRATSLEGLQIIGFQKNKVFAHPAVIEWSKTLSN